MTKFRLNRPKTPEFAEALRDAERDPSMPQPLCKGRWDEFVGYSTPPTREEAKAMCRDCDLLLLCGISARVQKPAWGVQAGIAWVNGRQSHWLKKSA